MSYTNSWSYTSPTATATVEIWATRDKANVTVYGKITCTFLYSSGYLAYDGSINWNIWSGNLISGAEVKGYSDRWYASSEMSRTRQVSFTTTTTASSISIGFGNSVPSGRECFYVPNTTITLDVPSFSYPSKPTWINVTPNPAHVYSPTNSQSMVVSWGGASAGTLGTLYYDVEIRARSASGSWTEWLRRSNAQSGTSWTELPINGLQIYTVGKAPGVAYQYRVQSSDGTYGTSGFIESGVITTSFTAPTAPTKYTVSNSTPKPSDSVTVSWSGASGGAGSISKYQIALRKYSQSSSSWSSWKQIKEQTGTSISIIPESYYSDLANKDVVQMRVTVVNSYSVTASSSTTIMNIKDNVIWIKVGGVWKEGQPYIKVNGTWKEGQPYIKVGGVWKEST